MRLSNVLRPLSRVLRSLRRIKTGSNPEGRRPARQKAEIVLMLDALLAARVARAHRIACREAAARERSNGAEERKAAAVLRRSRRNARRLADHRATIEGQFWALEQLRYLSAFWAIARGLKPPVALGELLEPALARAA